MTGGGRHSVANDSDDYTSESDEEEERQKHTEPPRNKGKGRERGDVRDRAGRELPAAERARVDRTVK